MEYSPKSSPHRSPARGQVAQGEIQDSRQPGGGPLKLSITLGGQKPTIINRGPFYLMTQEPMPVSETGASNLMSSKGLEGTYVKLTTKRMKDSLSSFLPNLPGVVDNPGTEDNSSLRGLIEKPPVGGKELHPLSHAQLAGFRLHPGPLPDQYRMSMQVQTKKKKKPKKSKHRSSGGAGSGADTPLHNAHDSAGSLGGGASGSLLSGGMGGVGQPSETWADSERERSRKEKKHKNKDKDKDATESDKEKKKRKKEKKRKKNKDDKD